jgi:hypothetical protein
MATDHDTNRSISASAVPYAVAADVAWNEAAARTAQVELRPDEDDPLEIVVIGPCPRCGHESLHLEPLLAFRGAEDEAPFSPEQARELNATLARLGRPLHQRNVEAICGCSTPHPETPPDRLGCGASWTLTVSWAQP